MYNKEEVHRVLIVGDSGVAKGGLERFICILFYDLNIYYSHNCYSDSNLFDKAYLNATKNKKNSPKSTLDYVQEFKQKSIHPPPHPIKVPGYVTGRRRYKKEAEGIFLGYN